MYCGIYKKLKMHPGQSINQSINQSIFYLVTCRPEARKLVQNTNVGYKILHGKMYIKIRKQYKKLAIITSPKIVYAL